MIKAILIDPFACEVKHVDLTGNDNSDDLASYYAALSHEIHPVGCFDVARARLLKGNDAIFIDDNGLLQPRERFFIHVGYHAPLAGKGLIVGATDSGKAISAQTDIKHVRRCVVFLERIGDSLHATTTPWTKGEKASQQ